MIILQETTIRLSTAPLQAAESKLKFLNTNTIMNIRV